MARFVFVPGAGGAGWFWHLVERELRRDGHQTVAVELPADDPAAGLARYAELIAAAIGDRPETVLVTQSLGGFSAPIALARTPVALLVTVNAMLPAPGETAGAWGANTGQKEAAAEMAERDGRTSEFDVDEVFWHDVPPDVVAEAAAHARDETDTVFDTPWPLDTWPDVPTKVVIGRDDRLFPAPFQRRVCRERLGITPVELPGGHLLALSQPAGLARQLTEYAAQLP